MGRDPGHHPLHVIVDGGEVDLGALSVHPELAGVAIMRSRVTGCEQRLGRHAAIVQAITAHLAALEKRHAGAHLYRTGRDGQTARAGTDHTQIHSSCFTHDNTSFCISGKGRRPGVDQDAAEGDRFLRA